MPVNTTALINFVTREYADRHPDEHVTRKNVEDIVGLLLSEISHQVADGMKVEIGGFGMFNSKETAPRKVRDYDRDEIVTMPAKRVPFFVPANGFRDLVNTTKPLANDEVLRIRT